MPLPIWLKKKLGMKVGFGLSDVKLLKKLRDTIKDVPVVDPGAGLNEGEGPVPNRGGNHCLLATCYKLGAIDLDTACNLQWSTNFARHFCCTTNEAFDVLFGKRMAITRHRTGKDYANAITELLKRYNYE